MFTIADRAPTPNPNAFKFHTGSPLVENGSLNFASMAEASKLPLASELFRLGTVTAVMVAEDFVSVSGSEDTDWDEAEGVVARELAEWSVADANRLAEQQAADATARTAGQSSHELYDPVNAVLEQYVRPALAGDGGGIELVGIEGKTVTIRYQGACGSCPTSRANTLMAIENLLQHQIDPEIEVVPE
ncbi:MAG: iron-sulfur cluster scaffold, mitochondrial [Candidatus Sumerlaeota bacterium]|nr:iron-sulfur cluster scaffold, mitochondrial [Candidatus Sumerlaeota bacterium]